MQFETQWSKSGFLRRHSLRLSQDSNARNSGASQAAARRPTSCSTHPHCNFYQEEDEHREHEVPSNSLFTPPVMTQLDSGVASWRAVWIGHKLLSLGYDAANSSQRQNSGAVLSWNSMAPTPTRTYSQDPRRHVGQARFLEIIPVASWSTRRHSRDDPRGDVGVSGESARILAVSVSALWNASFKPVLSSWVLDAVKRDAMVGGRFDGADNQLAPAGRRRRHPRWWDRLLVADVAH